MSNYRESPGQTKGTMERLYLLADPGALGGSLKELEEVAEERELWALPLLRLSAPRPCPTLDNGWMYIFGL